MLDKNAMWISIKKHEVWSGRIESLRWRIHKSFSYHKIDSLILLRWEINGLIWDKTQALSVCETFRLQFSSFLPLFIWKFLKAGQPWNWCPTGYRLKVGNFWKWETSEHEIAEVHVTTSWNFCLYHSTSSVVFQLFVREPTGSLTKSKQKVSPITSIQNDTILMFFVQFGFLRPSENFKATANSNIQTLRVVWTINYTKQNTMVRPTEENIFYSLTKQQRRLAAKVPTPQKVCYPSHLHHD